MRNLLIISIFFTFMSCHKKQEIHVKQNQPISLSFAFHCQKCGKIHEFHTTHNLSDTNEFVILPCNKKKIYINKKR